MPIHSSVEQRRATSFDYTALPGTGEAQLTPEMLRQLPKEAPPALARVRVEAAGSDAIRAFLPDGHFWGTVAEPMNGWLGVAEPYGGSR